MKRTLELELDVITDLSSVKFASKVEQAVREVVETVNQFVGSELEVIFSSSWVGARFFSDGDGVKHLYRSISIESERKKVIYSYLRSGMSSHLFFAYFGLTNDY